MRRRNIVLSALAASALTLGAVAAPAFAEEEAAMSETESEILHSGVWTKKSYKSAGDWSIFQDGDKTYVKLSRDFKTRSAPDLKIFLSPLEARRTSGRNATDGSVLVAPLSSNEGEQIYEIPEGVDLTQFKSILIHCQQFSKLWSAADLV